MTEPRDLEVTTFNDPGGRRLVTVVRLSGWTVHIDGVAVTVPRQDIAGKTIDDLRECLDAAYVLAGVRFTAGPPAYRPPDADALIGTLKAAQDIARAQWHKQSHDVYRCTGKAWEETGMVVPWTVLIGALRKALPPGTTLIDFNDRAEGGAQIQQLFAGAIASLRAGVGESGAA